MTIDLLASSPHRVKVTQNFTAYLLIIPTEIWKANPMKSKSLFFFIVLIALVMTACTRSITTPVQAPLPSAQPGIPAGQEGESITLASPVPVEGVPQATETVTAPLPGTPAEPVLCAYPTDWTPYVVQEGDTLESLAAGLGVTPNDLYVANCLYAVGVLQPGTVIVLPPPAQVVVLTPAAPPVEPTAAAQPQPVSQKKKESCKPHYTVRPGDWVYKIGRRCNIHPYAIIYANNLYYPYWLHPGQYLYLPPNAPPFPKH